MMRAPDTDQDLVISPARPAELALRDLLSSMCAGAPLHTAERGKTLSRARQTSDFVTILHSGLCIAARSTPNGRQQTIAIYVPGDIIDHDGFTLGVVRSTTVALAPVSFHRLPHARLRDALSRDDRLAAAFCRYIAFQGALAQEWMLSMGQRAAYERTAHLLCEIVFRMRSAAMGEATSCAFPLTQVDLADTLGMSVVHVNRTLQRLRQDGLITIGRGKLEVLRWADLVSLAGFDTSYLEPMGQE